jgi:hypothetical protein
MKSLKGILNPLKIFLMLILFSLKIFVVYSAEKRIHENIRKEKQGTSSNN